MFILKIFDLLDFITGPEKMEPFLLLILILQFHSFNPTFVHIFALIFLNRLIYFKSILQINEQVIQFRTLKFYKATILESLIFVQFKIKVLQTINFIFNAVLIFLFILK